MQGIAEIKEERLERSNENRIFRNIFIIVMIKGNDISAPANVIQTSVGNTE